MHFPRSLLRLLPLAASAIASDHQYEHDYIEDGIIDDVSFGEHHGPVWDPKDHRQIGGWTIAGEGYTPELYSDRIVLVPPHPGNRRGAVWTDYPEHHPEWEAEFEFQAHGPHNGAGNLNFWYVQDFGNAVGSQSIYTVGKFDGIAVVVSQFGNHGGSVRAFLNDGTLDFKHYGAVDGLSFGQCDFAYRNLGRFSRVKVSQTYWAFTVEVDGHPCISTHNIHLPHGYHFGLTAASSEPADSFEARSFIVHKLKEGKRVINKHPEQHHYSSEQEQWQHDAHEWLQHEQQQQHGEPVHHESPSHQQTGNEHHDWQWTSAADKMHDSSADHYRTESERFSDLHDRLQGIYHQMDLLYYDISIMKQQQDELVELLRKMDREILNTEREVKHVENTVTNQELQETIHSMYQFVHEGHFTLANELHRHHPRLQFFAFLIVISNVMIAGSYVVYKRRKDSQPKKYL